MPCPSCGGTARVAIAPGYWECTSSVVRDEIAKPVGYDQPIPVPTRASCGTRYQEGPVAGTESCKCGVFAIGRCQSCGAPVCGVHGELVGDKLECAGCRERRENGARAGRARAEAEARRERDDRHEQLVASVRDAAGEAARSLGGRRRLQLVRVAGRGVMTGGMGGSSAVHWLEADGRFGAGWFALRWERPEQGAEEGGGVHYSVLLSDEGRLFWAGRDVPVQLGRKPRRKQEPVLAVGEEIDLDHPSSFEPWAPGEGILEQLHAGLRELASGEREPLFPR